MNRALPEGSDTLTADPPWHRGDAPEPEPNQAEQDLWPLVDWDESATEQGIILACNVLNTEGAYDIISVVMGCGKDLPILCISDELRQGIVDDVSDYIWLHTP